MNRRIFLMRGLKGAGGLVGAGLYGCSGDLLTPLLRTDEPAPVNVLRNLAVSGAHPDCVFNPNESPPTFEIEQTSPEITYASGDVLSIAKHVDGTIRLSCGSPTVRPDGFTLPLRFGLDASPQMVSRGGYEDSGVRAGFGDETYRYLACLIRRDGQDRVALLLGDDTMSNDLPLAWTGGLAKCEIGIEGQFAVLSAEGHAPVKVDRVLLPMAEKAVELGCYEPMARLQANFAQVGPAAGVQPPAAEMGVTATQVQVFPQGAGKVQVQANLVPASGGGAFDPAAHGLSVRLLAGGARFYPVGDDFMPIHLDLTESTDSRKVWTLGAGEGDRTGIESCEIVSNTEGIEFKLVDTRTSIGQGDYASVTIAVGCGVNLGQTTVALQNRNGRWFL